MPIFVIFVFAAVIFGAGLMLAPALPTRQPRISLAGTLALAFVLCGLIAYTAAFKWDTLIIDYLWFGLIVVVFLTGSFSSGMFKAEAAGRKETGWPGPRELAFLLMAAIVFATPALVLPVPLDTDAQGFGYLALALRSSGSLTTLAPFHPEISYLYSPGFTALVAYLGHALPAGLQNIELALGAVLAVLFVWLAYDFGNEIDTEQTRRTGIAMGVCALLGTGLMAADLDSHYTTLLGLVFSMAFLTFAVRFHQHGKRLDFIGAAVTLACVPLSHPDTTIILMLGYVPWLAVMWLARPRPTLARWFGLAVGIPILALILIAPWLIKVAPLLTSSIQSPFEISTRHLLVMVAYHGGLIVVLALGGVVLAVRRRSPVDLLMVVWLALIVDFSSVGLLQGLFPGVLAPILKYDYPFSIAWHGPIIPYTYLAANALLWIVERLGRARAELWIKRLSLPIINVIALLAVLIIGFKGQAVALSRSTPLATFGAFSSAADVQAMQWLAQNAPPDALILNHPGPQEGDWAPIITQRDTVYFRPQPFFRGTELAEARQTALLTFWKNPMTPTNADLLAHYHISYILLPQIIARPDTFPSMFRWRPPSLDALLNVSLDDVPYLTLAFDAEGARVYQVNAQRSTLLQR